MISLTTLPDASRAPSNQVAQLRQARLRATVRARPGRPAGSRFWLRLRVLLGVLAEHAEQAAHLVSRPGRCRRSRRTAARPRPQAGRGQPAGLRLHGDHRDVVRDHVVQLTGDPGPLPPGQVIGQHSLGELTGGAVGLGLLARPPHQCGHRRDRIAAASSTVSTRVSALAAHRMDVARAIGTAFEPGSGPPGRARGRGTARPA